MNQNYYNNNIILKISKESITFNNFNLLLIRFSVLTSNIKDISKPIYLLNKTDDYVFNNVIIRDKLSPYQENFYLIILDFKIYSTNLNFIMKEIESISLTSKKNFIILIILFLNFFLFFAIVIFIILFSLLFIYNF